MDYGDMLYESWAKPVLEDAVVEEMGDVAAADALDDLSENQSEPPRANATAAGIVSEMPFLPARSSVSTWFVR